MNEAAMVREVTPSEETKAAQLPKPAGFKILCAVPQLDSTYEEEGVIVRPQQFIKREQQATCVLFVVAMGPDCYLDKDRYPSGALCKEGDFIVVRTYAGTRFTIHGKEFAVILEDQVECTVEDPRGIGRV